MHSSSPSTIPDSSKPGLRSRRASSSTIVNDPPAAAIRSSPRIRNMRKNTPSSPTASRIKSIRHSTGKKASEGPGSPFRSSSIGAPTEVDFVTTAPPSPVRPERTKEDYINSVNELFAEAQRSFPDITERLGTYPGTLSPNEVASLAPIFKSGAFTGASKGKAPSTPATLSSQSSSLSIASTRGNYVKRSPVWAHANRNPDGAVFCNYCKKQLNYNTKTGGSTSSIRHHLRKKHEVSFGQEDSPAPRKPDSQSTLGFKTEYLPREVGAHYI